MPPSKSLAAFDFDHTIIDQNSDIVVRDLIPKEAISEDVKRLDKTDGWTSFMQEVFKILHSCGGTEEDIKSAVNGIPATPGMAALIESLHKELDYDVIIISDSNAYFINTWLRSMHLNEFITKVFTNSAHFDKDGVLRLQMFHVQNECKLSTKNLCKGRILEEFIASQKEAGVVYKKIVYVGDGSNDLCPILRLDYKDLACVRENYPCLQMIRKVQESILVQPTGGLYELKADVLVWSNGEQILNAIRG